MKLISNRFMALVIVTIITTIGIISCSKKNDATSADSKEAQQKARIANLAEAMYVESDESGDAALNKQIADLTADEYKIYLSARQDVEISLAMKGSERAPALTREEAIAELQPAWDYRVLMDEQAVEKFGAHTNKLTTAQRSEVMKTAETLSNAKVKKTMSGINSVSGTMACLQGYYCCSTEGVAFSGIYWYTRKYVYNSWQDIPCDSEYWFSGSGKRYIRGTTTATRNLLDSYGYRLGRNNSGSSTNVIVGYWRMHDYIGTEGNFYAKME